MTEYAKISIPADNRHVLEYGASVMITSEMGRWLRKRANHCMFEEQLDKTTDGYHYYCFKRAIHFFFSNPSTAMQFKLKFLGQ